MLSILFKTTMDKTFVLLVCKPSEHFRCIRSYARNFHFDDDTGIQSFSNCTALVVVFFATSVCTRYYHYFHSGFFFLLSDFLCSVCSSCFGCSFFYLRHYFSFSVFNSLGCVLCFVHSAGVIQFILLLSFFGCCRIPTWTVFPLFSLTWRIHHSDHFIKWDSFRYTHSILLNTSREEHNGWMWLWHRHMHLHWHCGTFAAFVQLFSPVRCVFFSDLAAWMRCDSVSVSVCRMEWVAWL